MPQYSVVAPCVVGGKHYTRAHGKPVEVDEAEAAQLVEAGTLEPVASPAPVTPAAGPQAQPVAQAEAAAEAAADEPTARRPRRG